jgi:GntR family transcriptional regulator/MocR family aminotransferase
MLLSKFPLDGQGTRYEQLARVLKRAIVAGHFSPGERLPASRELARRLGLSRNTVLTAYEILRAEQLTITNERSGTRVAPLKLPEALAAPPAFLAPQSRYGERTRRLGPCPLGPQAGTHRFDFYYGGPSVGLDLMRAWSHKLAAAARRAGPDYPDPMGLPALRRAVAQYLARRRGVVCTEADILIVGGTQQAVALAARAVLNEGDTVALEDPHYHRLMEAVTAHGARVVHVRTDANGIVTDELRAHRSRMICVTPSHQFPSGVILTLERRLALLEIAAQHDSWILEDDYDSEFQYRGRPLAALRSLDFSGRVIYVGTFSKTLFPAMRLGFMVCPAGIREDLRRVKRLDDLGAPSAEQAALAALLDSRQFERYLRKTRVELDRRRHALLEGLRRCGAGRVEIVDTQAGVHVAAWLNEMTYAELERLVELAKRRSVALYPIHPHYHTPPQRPGLLFGYARLAPDAIARGCALFGECLHELKRCPAGRAAQARRA